MSTFIVCGPSIYKFNGWTFEMHSYCGPWPLRKNGELRARAGRRFWKVWEQFDALTDDEKQKHRTHTGGCFVVGK